ncbi:Pentatricopeptide repeat-containing protein [Artemisia annua]|uniref:Pentatricopeptide repeat-containing protein n=1 Tax=Artemisia annua TaxID=35608 RepID=A0A2U1KGB7_ARTAN|nr:Pentatricopeptide repeat-containing protein [Artemisia annua]
MINRLIDQECLVEASEYLKEMMDADVMPQPDNFDKLMKGLRKLYNRQIAAEIIEKVRQMATERKITFKMYKRRGERDLKEKIMAKNDCRKIRNRKRQWGSSKAGSI